MLELSCASFSFRSGAPRQVPIALPQELGRNRLVRRDDALFWEGDAIASYYRIVSGAVRLCKQLPDGRRHVANFHAAGDLISPEVSGRSGFTAEAIVDSVICQYSRTVIDRLVQTSPQFAEQLLSLAYGRLAWAQSQMVALGRKTADERIASFLVEHAGRLPDHNRLMKMPMSRSDIADYLGLTVETVSRVLSKLRRDEVIDLPDIHSVRILDEERLAGISEGHACGIPRSATPTRRDSPRVSRGNGPRNGAAQCLTHTDG